MMQAAIRYRTAQDLFAACATAAEDMTAIPTPQPSPEFCRALLAGPTPEEAIVFCAYLLADRVVIWWGHECLRQLSELLDDYDLGLLDDVRRRIEEPAGFAPRLVMNQRQSRHRSPAGWVALAAGLENGRSGDIDEASLRPILLSRAVHTGILAGLARVSTVDRPAVLSAFVRTGLQFAESAGAAEIS